VNRVLRCAIALSRQHTVTPSVFELRVSSPTQHVAVYTIREIDFKFTERS